MLPNWLLPPPNGLTDAERRALEGFFIAEDVKATADLLSLARKTIENELLTARQTMGESKSWMAAIRYVFYAKRHGHPFIEPQLIPKIDRQVRRLVADYLESVEEQAISTDRQSMPTWEIIRYERDEEEATSTVNSEDKPTVQFNTQIVVAEEFENQLRELTKVAANIYEHPRPKRRGLLVATIMIASVAAAGFWVDANRKLTLEQIDEQLTSIEPKIIANGAKDTQAKRCAFLVSQLCEQYETEKWGPKEAPILSVMEKHPQELEVAITWSKVNDKALNLQILSNGYRGFELSRTLFGHWFPELEAAVIANSGDKTEYMVRALCGITYGCLNNAKVTGIALTDSEIRTLKEPSALRAAQIADKERNPGDYAEALRHLAMAQDNLHRKIRLEKCNQAMSIYGKIPGEQAKRGVGQCLLSIAESGWASGVDRTASLLRAYGVIRNLGNKVVENECIQELSSALSNLLPSSVDADALDGQKRTAIASIRNVFWEQQGVCAREQEQNAQIALLLICIDADSVTNLANIPIDLQVLVLSQFTTNVDEHIQAKLCGFVTAKFARRNQSLDPRLESGANGLRSSVDFRIGEKMDYQAAIRLARIGASKLPDQYSIPIKSTK